MLRIAICDDDSAAVQANQNIAEDCLKQCGSAGEIAAYTHSDNLLYDITEDGFFFDLILLDIEMPGSTGMELAGKIRPFLPNVKIIFITSHVEYAIDAFELSVFRYVPKNDVARRLPGAICDAIRLIELEEGKFYTIQTNSRLEKIPYKEILFLSRDGKNTSITTAGGAAKVRKSLQQVYEELAAEEFIFIDRGGAGSRWPAFDRPASAGAKAARKIRVPGRLRIFRGRVPRGRHPVRTKRPGHP